MGIKKLPWKKIVAIVLSFLFVLSAIISIVKGWDVILNCLRYLGNLILEILKFLINPIVRDVLLFVLISGALRWLFLVNKKLKKLLIGSEEGKKAVPKEKPKEDKEFELTETHIFILGNIAVQGDSGENTHRLFDIFKKTYPEVMFLDLQVIIDELMAAKLIDFVDFWDEDEQIKIYEATEKGRKYAKNILDKARRTKEK